MHTLEDLKSGKLNGIKRLKLACGLTEFPLAILKLSSTLEILDLSDNNLSELPDEIVQLKKLKVFFAARNRFTEFPKVLKSFPVLNMIGFKSNLLHTVAENVFPPQLNWLILTDNKIKKLPQSIGEVTLLQKCALAGNLIEELPIEMANCTQLELLRISANKLKDIPHWLFELPKLSWVAFGGNSATYQPKLTTDLDTFDWNELDVSEQLGEGASGFISKANWKTKNQDVAVKIFKGAVTSDGLPDDEMDISIAAGRHENLIQVLGKIKNHSEAKSGLIMELITPTYLNLGNPPTFESCTRDVFDKGSCFKVKELLKIAKEMASVCEQLHSKGINHGDFYAHNILIDKTKKSILGDFGAASFYDTQSAQSGTIQRVEVRAFGCLLEDLLALINLVKSEESSLKFWKELITKCTQPTVKMRPSFSEIIEQLADFDKTND